MSLVHGMWCCIAVFLDAMAAFFPQKIPQNKTPETKKAP